MRIRNVLLFVMVAALSGVMLVTVQGRTADGIADQAGQLRSLSVSKVVPDRLNYQGYLVDAADSTSVTATLEMTFRLFDSETKGAELWSETHPAVDVTNGLFHVLLGGVSPFPGDLFDGSSLWLQTEVGSEVLAPRKPLVSVAFSQRAGDADHAATAEWATEAQHAVRADTAEHCPSSAVWTVAGDDVYRETGKVGIGTVTPLTELDVSGSVKATIYYGDGSNLTGISGTMDNDWTISGNDIYSALPGNVGIGTTTPQVKLSLGTDFNAQKLALWDGVDDFYGFGAELGRITICASDTVRMTVSSNGNVGIGTWLPLKKLHLLREDEPVTLRIEDWGKIYYDLTVDSLALNISSILNSDVLVLKSGNVGIGTADPDVKLTVEGPGNSMTIAKINQTGNRNYMGLRLDRNDTETWLVGLGPLNDNLFFRRTASSNDMVIDTSGNVGIGTSSPSRLLHLLGVNPRILIEASSISPEINFKNSDDASSEIWSLYKHGTTDDLRFYQSGDKVTIQSSTGNVGIGTITPGQRLTVRGNLLIESIATGLSVVELGEGLDYAEGFDVSDAQEIGPGSVLIIDPDNPGNLKICDRPYDSKVAGIVAGARGQGSGVRLGTGHFDHDVALAGRVYCNVDATEAGIEPGDLLTTSATPGYAMKTTNSALAQGAILGKAMERLEQGQRGQILVLVTLQ